MRVSILSGNLDELRLVQGVQVLSPLSVEKLTIRPAAMFRRFPFLLFLLAF